MAEPDKAKNALDELLDELNDVEIPSILPKILQHSAAFYRYSPRNQLLLALQAQQRGFTPTLVGGFNTWKSYGRYAAKGSKGLKIFAPAGGGKTIAAIVDGVPREYRSAKAVPNGAKILSETETGKRYRLATVFDVSQTAGEAMSELSQFIAPTSSTNSEALLEQLTKYIKGKGWEVEFSPEQQGLAGGYANHADKKITVGSWEPLESQLATLAHEAGHMILHSPTDKLGGNYHTSREARGYAELEAEGVALAFLAAHGIDHSAGAAQYMAGWAETARQVERVNSTESGDAKPITRQDALLTVTGRILTTTNQMLEAIKPAGSGGRLEWNANLEPGQKTPSPEVVTTLKPEFDIVVETEVETVTTTVTRGMSL